MLKTIRLFKRHYYKCRAIADELSQKGSFTLNFEANDDRLWAKSSIPDEETTVRFVVALRNFLNPSSSQHFKHVWAKIMTVFGAQLPEDLVTEIETSIKRLSTGPVNLVINNAAYSAEHIYELISEGTYFEEIPHTRNLLHELIGIPLVGPIAWQQFYWYSLQGYKVVSHIASAIRHIEQTDKYRSMVQTAQPAVPRCIYCLTTAPDAFLSEEHVYPEALGNEEMLLPRGIVCDNCNNRVLSSLDEALVKFEPIAYLRVCFVSSDKKGRLPKANFQNVSLEKTHPRQIKIMPKDKTGRMRDEVALGDGWVSWKQNFRGKPVNAKLIGRALYKVALETVAYDQGPAKVLESRFDRARDFVLGREDFPNNLLMRTRGIPHPSVHIGYADNPEYVIFEIEIYGLCFLLSLTTGPILKVNGELAAHDFTSFALHEDGREE